MLIISQLAYSSAINSELFLSSGGNNNKSMDWYPFFSEPKNGLNFQNIRREAGSGGAH